MYGTYITNRQGGTGTDFLSHKTIEDNGGVRVIICVVPDTWGELCQFKRRTARMSNKGVVFFVYKDKAFTGQSQMYMPQMETVLKDRETKHLMQLQRLLNQHLNPANNKKKNVDEKDQIDEVKQVPVVQIQADKVEEDKQEKVAKKKGGVKKQKNVHF